MSPKSAQNLPAVLSKVIPWLMFLSGAAALIYEVIWMRMLIRAFGITVYAVATLVAVYMGGLALGAHVAARLKKPRRWLELYGWTEALAGLAALAATWAMARLPGLIAALGGDAPLSEFYRVALSLPVLLPPTVLFGATLPILTRFCTSEDTAGKLYGINTLGAAAGLLLAGFWAIGAWGETRTVACAVLFNAVAAAAAIAMSRRWPQTGPVEVRRPSVRDAQHQKLILWLFGLSGFCALGYEILWSRQLILVLGNSTYAFSLLLLIYLAGIGIGSRWAARGKSEARQLLENFGRLECLLGISIFSSLAFFQIFGRMLDSPRYLYSPLETLPDLLLMLFEALLMIAPASLVMGLLFPAAVKLCSREAREDGAAVGRLYACNTFGGILGSLAAGFWCIGRLGTHRSFIALALINILIGLVALTRSGRMNSNAHRRSLFAGKVSILALGALALLVFVYDDPTIDIISGRLRHRIATDFQILFHDESAAATITGIAATQGKGLLINGIETAGIGIQGSLMAVLPNLMMEAPQSTLVICFGAGTTFRTASRLGGNVDAVDLVGDVVRRMPAFYPDAEKYLQDSSHRVIIDDGRQYLLRTRRRYDSIIVDAAPPLFSSGAVNLYTSDFMSLVLEHLSSQGIFTLWLPMHSFEEDYWHILRSMADVFPHVTVWTAPHLNGVLFFGSLRPFSWPGGALENRIKKRLNPQILPGITEQRFRQGFELTEEEIRNYTRRFAPVTDERPSTEFPLMKLLRNQPFQNSDDFLMKAKNPNLPASQQPE